MQAPSIELLAVILFCLNTVCESCREACDDAALAPDDAMQSEAMLQHKTSSRDELSEDRLQPPFQQVRQIYSSLEQLEDDFRTTSQNTEIPLLAPNLSNSYGRGNNASTTEQVAVSNAGHADLNSTSANQTTRFIPLNSEVQGVRDNNQSSIHREAVPVFHTTSTTNSTYPLRLSSDHALRRVRACWQTARLHMSLLFLGTEQGSFSALIAALFVLAILVLVGMSLIVYYQSKDDLYGQEEVEPFKDKPHVQRVQRYSSGLNETSQHDLPEPRALQSLSTIHARTPSKTMDSAGEPAESSSALCPELVVPQQRECTLVVPALEIPGACQTKVWTVDDKRGVPIFNASISRTGSDYAQTLIRISLSTIHGDMILASCSWYLHGIGLPGGSIVMYKASSDVYGELRKESETYIFATQRASKQLRFVTQNADRVLVIDENQKLLAEALPESQNSMCVRMGPMVDAVLILLAILGIRLLGQTEATHGPRTRTSLSPLNGTLHCLH